MSTYKLANGYPLSDEEIEERAKQWEDGSWKGELITLRSDEDGSPDTRKCPQSSCVNKAIRQTVPDEFVNHPTC